MKRTKQRQPSPTSVVIDDKGSPAVYAWQSLRARADYGKECAKWVKRPDKLHVWCFQKFEGLPVPFIGELVRVIGKDASTARTELICWKPGARGGVNVIAHRGSCSNVPWKLKEILGRMERTVRDPVTGGFAPLRHNAGTLYEGDTDEG